MMVSLCASTPPPTPPHLRRGIEPDVGWSFANDTPWDDWDVRRATLYTIKNMLDKPAKWYLLQRLLEYADEHKGQVSILELGAGRAYVIKKVLEQFPNLRYVGIEPDPISAKYAQGQLAGFENAKIVHSLAYNQNQPIAEQDKFDLVMSLSVLEHVKDLKSFFAFGSAHTKPDGAHIHVYDLGHALYPSNLKEKLQVALCNSVLRQYIPENKIARYVPLEEVESVCGAHNIIIEQVTYHNMPGHVSWLKKAGQEELMGLITDLEIKMAQKMPPGLDKEKLFPSVCVWGHLRGQ